MKQLLIVGLDPGTTAGYAVLSLDGNLITGGSGKELDLKTLISVIIDFGKPLLIGCDKEKVPEFVQHFAAQFRAVVVAPAHDLLIDEKRTMTKNFVYTTDHERDALASAVFAHNKFKPLLERIKKKIVQEEQALLATELVVKHGMSISAALSVLTSQESVAHTVRDGLTKQHLTQEHFVMLHEQIVRLQKTIAELRKNNDQSSKQKNQLLQEVNRLRQLRDASLERKAGSLLLEKEQRIRFLASQVQSFRQALQQHKKNTGECIHALAKLRQSISLPRLKNITGNQVVHAQNARIVFVDDPFILTPVASAELQKSTQYILTKKLPTNQKESPFVFVDANKLVCVETPLFVFVNEHELMKLLPGEDAFTKIVREYKKDREQF